jgi:WD40 repeat protein
LTASEAQLLHFLGRDLLRDMQVLTRQCGDVWVTGGDASTKRGLALVGGGAGSMMLPLAGAGTPSRDAGGVVSAMSSAPAVDSEGRALDDWNVVHNPTCSSTKMNISLRHTLSHDSVVCCVRFSTDGRYMSTGCNKMAVLYDAETGNRICMFSSDGASVVENAEDLSTLSRPGGGCVDSYVRSVCFSPDSKYLVAGAEDKTIKVWDIAQRRLRHSLVGHTKDIYSVDYSSDGRFIISGSGDKRAKLWDVVSGECVRTFGDEEGPKDGVTSVAMSPDGRYVAAGSLDRVVRLWEASTGALLEKYDGHTDSVYSVSFSPDGKFLASGSLDKTLKLWDLTQVGKAAPGTLAGREAGRDKCRHTFQGHKDFVLSVVFAPQGTWLISGSKDRSVQFWDPRKVLAAGNTRAPNEAEHPSGDHGPVLILQGHQNSVISVAHSPAGMLFATGSGAQPRTTLPAVRVATPSGAPPRATRALPCSLPPEPVLPPSLPCRRLLTCQPGAPDRPILLLLLDTSAFPLGLEAKHPLLLATHGVRSSRSAILSSVRATTHPTLRASTQCREALHPQPQTPNPRP